MSRYRRAVRTLDAPYELGQSLYDVLVINRSLIEAASLYLGLRRSP
jgi:hypothetical protein